MARVFYDKDADLSLIRGKKVAIVGYGSQGHAHALNLKDSGVAVKVGLHATSKSLAKAKAAGLEVGPVAEVAAWADVVMILTPDTSQAAIYESQVAPNLAPGKTLMFAHGFNVRFGTITPRPDVDVSMIAPKGPGHRVRETYVAGGGVPALLAVHQDATGKAREVALSYASALVQAAFETLVEAGYAPEIAYFECLHELKLIVDLMYEGGLEGMRYSISDTAEYGDLTRGPRIVDAHVRDEMGKILEEIRSGAFAEEFIGDIKAGGPRMKELRGKAKGSQIEAVGKELRGMMPFVSGGKK